MQHELIVIGASDEPWSIVQDLDERVLVTVSDASPANRLVRDSFFIVGELFSGMKETEFFGVEGWKTFLHGWMFKSPESKGS